MFLKLGFRFYTNADKPYFADCLLNKPWKRAVSCFSPWSRVVSNAEWTADFAASIDYDDLFRSNSVNSFTFLSKVYVG